MSEPLNDKPTEDVLSSIRRLVSEDLQPNAPAVVEEDSAPAGGKLLLTPALRIIRKTANAMPDNAGPLVLRNVVMKNDRSGEANADEHSVDRMAEAIAARRADTEEDGPGSQDGADAKAARETSEGMPGGAEVGRIVAPGGAGTAAPDDEGVVDRAEAQPALDMMFVRQRHEPVIAAAGPDGSERSSLSPPAGNPGFGNEGVVRVGASSALEPFGDGLDWTGRAGAVTGRTAAIETEPGFDVDDETVIADTEPAMAQPVDAEDRSGDVEVVAESVVPEGDSGMMFRSRRDADQGSMPGPEAVDGRATMDDPTERPTADDNVLTTGSLFADEGGDLSAAGPQDETLSDEADRPVADRFGAHGFEGSEDDRDANADDEPMQLFGHVHDEPEAVGNGTDPDPFGAPESRSLAQPEAATTFDASDDAVVVADDMDPPPFASLNADRRGTSDGDPTPDPAGADHIEDAVLLEVVRNMIRAELQGALGERITRNVRKLVRAEIQRVLATRDMN